MNDRLTYRNVLRFIAPLLVLLSIFLWVTGFDNEQMPPYALLGAYTHKWFALNVAVTYFALWATIMLFYRPGYGTLLGILVSHIAVVLLLIVLELPAILGLVNYQNILPSGMAWAHEGEKQWIRPGIKIEGEAPMDLSIVYGIDAPMVKYSFQTDRFGLRNPIDKDNAAVLLLGDSILVAGLVPVQETVSERLERALDIGVMNISQIGYSPQESLERLESTGLSLNGRLVVHFIFEGNDLLDHKRWRNKYSADVNKPWMPADSRDPEKVPWPDSGLAKSLMNMLLMHKKVLPEKRAAICKVGQQTPEKVYFFYDGAMIRDNMDEFPRLASLLEKASENIISRGGKYAVVYVPAKITALHEHCSFASDSHYAKPSARELSFGEQLEKSCNRLEIPFIDTTPALKSAVEKGVFPFLTADTHLNGHGHAALSNVLSPFINSLRSAAVP